MILHGTATLAKTVSVLLEKYGKDRSGPERDMTLNYLGYSTE